MIKMVRIALIVTDTGEYAETFYRIETESNATAIADSVTLCEKQIKENKRNLEIVGASIEND